MLGIRGWAAFVILSGLLYLSALKETPSRTSSQTSTQEGLQLLHKMQNALGGAEKIAAINDYEEIVRAEIWNNIGTPMGEAQTNSLDAKSEFASLGPNRSPRYLRPLF